VSKYENTRKLSVNQKTSNFNKWNSKLIIRSRLVIIELIWVIQTHSNIISISRLICYQDLSFWVFNQITLQIIRVRQIVKIQLNFELSWVRLISSLNSTHLINKFVINLIMLIKKWWDRMMIRIWADIKWVNDNRVCEIRQLLMRNDELVF
jgi:hypothetical protein